MLIVLDLRNRLDCNDSVDEVVPEREKRGKNHIDFIANLQGECWKAEEVSASGGDDEVKRGQRMARVDFVATVQGDCWKVGEVPEHPR